jgi:cobalt-zinc-cadmium efflux system outer membrane protein
MSIRQLFLLSSLALASPWAAMAQVPAPEPLTLGQALQAARGNLDVVLARSALVAAGADVTAADHAPLPVLSAKLGSIDLQNGIGGGSLLGQKRIDKSLGVDWTWERGSKRALRTQAARQAEAAAQADLEDATLQQLTAAHAAFFDLLAAQERLLQVSALERSAAQLAATAARRVQAGDLAAQDAARTGIEAQRARADVLSAQLERQRAALALRQLTGWTLPADSLQARADWPGIGLDVALPDLAVAVQSRADVRAAQARLQAAQAALDGATALKRTDVTLGASVDHFPGTSTRLVEFRMQMPLQWGYGYEGEIGRAQAQLTQAQAAQEKVLRTATGEMQRLQFEALASAQRAQSYEADILPRARKVAEGAEMAYSKGAMSLTDLLDARRVLRTTQIEALAARTDAAKAAGAWQLRVRPETFLPHTTSTEFPK